jgi:hypothetical protein
MAAAAAMKTTWPRWPSTAEVADVELGLVLDRATSRWIRTCPSAYPA